MLEGLDLDVYLGGGLQESDVLRLSERGFAGGLVDPFTPVIRDLLKTPRPEAPTEAIAPAPAPRSTATPRTVPDPPGPPKDQGASNRKNVGSGRWAGPGFWANYNGGEPVGGLGRGS